MSECRACCLYDVVVPGDLDAGQAIYPTQAYSFVLTTCPIGVICPPGLLPITVDVSQDRVPPVIVPPNLGYTGGTLTLQGCQSLITGTIPALATAAQIQAVVAQMQSQFALQQAQCDVINRFRLGPSQTHPNTFTVHACLNVALTYTLAGQTGSGPYTVGIISGALPAGLAFSQPDTSTIQLTGTPTTASNSSFVVRTVDAHGIVVFAQYQVSVLGITNAPAAGSTGTAYSFQLTASGGVSPYTFALLSGSLPSGLAMNSAGLINGTPTTVETANFVVTVTDSNSNSCNSALSIDVANSGCSAMFAALAWQTFISGTNVGAASVTVVGNVITYSLTLPQQLGNRRALEAYFNIPAGPVAPLASPMNCNLHVDVQSWVGGDPGTSEYQYRFTDAQTAAVYYDSGDTFAVPVTSDHALVFPAGAQLSIDLVFGVHASTAPASFVVVLTLG